MRKKKSLSIYVLLIGLRYYDVKNQNPIISIILLLL